MPVNMFHFPLGKSFRFENSSNLLSLDSLNRNVRYLPPERLLGSKNNFKSDVWSLGVIITELVFGCTLWPTSNIAQVGECTRMSAFLDKSQFFTKTPFLKL